MLDYVITFFLLAVIAGAFGLWGLAGTFAGIAQFLAGLFILLFVLSLIGHVATGRRIDTPPL